MSDLEAYPFNHYYINERGFGVNPAGDTNVDAPPPGGGCNHKGDKPDRYILFDDRLGEVPDVDVVRWLPFGLVDVRIIGGKFGGAVMTVLPRSLWCDQ